MNCTHCGKIILDFMNYCPYCGHLEGNPVNTVDIVQEKEAIESLFQDEQYDRILEHAIQGSNIAKSYYVNYVLWMADQSQITDDEEFINNLKQKGNTSIFPMTALGIYLFYHGKKGFLGITNDDAIDKGRGIIQKSSDNGEPAAMTIVAEWLLTGDNVTKDEFSAYRMMKSAAEAGYPPAIYQLGIWHYKGIGGISKNKEQGFSLIEKAAFLGDVSAYQMISKKHDNWFKEELETAITSDDLLEIYKLITRQNQNSDDEFSTDWKREYNQCVNVNDYVALYKKIKKSNADNENIPNLLNWIELLLTNLLDLPLNETNIEDTLKIKADTEKALHLAEQYTCPQHFLHFKDDLKKLQLSFDDEVMSWLMEDVSLILRPKCKSQVSAYLSYLKSREKAVKATETIGNAIGGFIATIIISTIISVFFLPAGIIFFALVTIGHLMQQKEKSDFKKMNKTSRSDYLLINSLVGYGYSPIEPWMTEEVKYYEGDEYQNNIPSVLQQKEDKMKKSSANSKDGTSKAQEIHTSNSNASQHSPRAPITSKNENQEGEFEKIICLSCKRENICKTKFCKHCGASLVKELMCANCGSLLKSGMKFCSKCGTKISL